MNKEHLSVPFYLEGDIFKISIPTNNEISVGAVEGAIDGVTKDVKNKLAILVKAIISDEGRRVPEYKIMTELGSERTIERHIQLLRDANLIEFRGDAPKTGGYYLTEFLINMLKA